MLPPYLSPELLSLIGEQLGDHSGPENALNYHASKRALFSACLVSRQWNQCFTPFLYRKYQNIEGSPGLVDGEERDTSGQALYPFLRTLLARPNLARQVRTVVLRAWRLQHDFRTSETDECEHIGHCDPSDHPPGLRACLRANLKDFVIGGWLSVETGRRDEKKVPWDDSLDDKPRGWSNLLTWFWKDTVIILLLSIIPNVERLTVVDHRGSNTISSPFAWHRHLDAIAHGFQKLRSFQVASVHEWDVSYYNWARYDEIADCRSYDWACILSRPSLRRLSLDDWHVPIPRVDFEVGQASNDVEHLRMRFGKGSLAETHGIIMSCKALKTLDYVDSSSGFYVPHYIDLKLLARQHSASLRSLRLHIPTANPSLRDGVLQSYPMLSCLSLTHEVIFGSERIATGVPPAETLDSTPALDRLLPPNLKELEMVNGRHQTALYLQDFLAMWSIASPQLSICQLECVELENPVEVAETFQTMCGDHDIGMASDRVPPVLFGSIEGFSPKLQEDYPPTEVDIDQAEEFGYTLETGPPGPLPSYNLWTFWKSARHEMPASDFLER